MKKLARLFALTVLSAAPAAVASPEAAVTAEIVVERGYHPDRVVAKAGEPLRLRFIRKEQTPCSREVVFPSLDIRRELPPGEPVIVELPAQPPGEIEFHCGMNMLRGVVVVVAPRP